jgi:predicted chitinase
MDHEDKELKTYLIKVKKYVTGAPEEFLRWRLVLNKQMKNHGYSANYDMVMNLAQAMLAGHNLEEFLNEQWAQETKNKTHKVKEQAA